VGNTYVDPNYNLDSDANVADLIALKGGAPDADDKIYVYNGATLTVEQNLACLLISLGETSAGAATDGQRRGNLTVNAGVTVTFTGAADGLNSGVKSNPASAPGTALESKSNTLSILGTAASPTLFDNSVGAPNASYRYLLRMKYGIFGTMGHYTISNTYGNFSGINALLIPSSDTYTTATEHDLGSPTFVTGQIGAAHFNAIMLATDQACSLDVTVGDAVLTGGTTTTAKNLTLFYPSGGLNAYTGTFTWRSLKVTSAPAASSNVLLWILSPGNAVTRYMRSGQLSAADIRPTTTVPAGLAVANPSPTADGELVVTWTNAASYAAGDKVVVYNAADDSVLGILDATLGTGRISGLTNGTAYTVYAKATSDNYVFSDATANVGPTTCTGTDTPDGVNVAPDDTVRGVAGTIDLPAIAKVAPSDTLRGVAGTMDLPAINKVAPSDTLEGVAGTMDIPAISKVAPSDTLEGVAGTMDLPSITKVAPSDTLEGVAGTMDLPAITSVDPLDTLEGVDGTMDLPTLANIRTTDTLRSVPGTCTVPAAGDYRVGQQCGAAGTEVTGTLTEGALFSVILDNPVYAVGATATVTGGVTHPRTVVGATVTLTRKLKATGATVAVLVNESVDLVAGVQKTWATILGAACTFAPAAAQEEYLEAAITGGTPAVTATTSGQYPYAVIPAFTVPVLAVADDGDGSVTVTVTNNAGQTSRLYYYKDAPPPADTTWTLHGTTITGNGTISDLTGLTYGGEYWFVLVPYDATSGAWGPPSFEVPVTVVNTSATTPTRLVTRKQELVSRKVVSEDRDGTIVQAVYACGVGATRANQDLEPGDTLPDDSTALIISSQVVKANASAEELIQVTARIPREYS